MSVMRVATVLSALASLSAIASIDAVSSVGVIDRLPSRGGAAKLTRPRAFLRALGRTRVGRCLRRERLDERIRAARCTWTADDVAGAKVAGLVVALPLLFAPAPAPVTVLPISLVAFRLPDIVLSRAARRWNRDASREVPLFLDLLTVAASAGLAPQQAVRVAVDQIRGPLAEELRHALGMADLGRRWRDELRIAADRLALPELGRAVALLHRTETLGASTADEMGRLAADVRSERRSRAAERARTAPVKMLFPLVFLILPAFLLLTVVPVLLTTVRSIR
jgi:Flp pilus assembly protein TadB